MSEKPSILIGVPCYGPVDPEILEDFMRLAYHAGRRMPQYDFKLGIKTKSEQFRARNAIVEAALQHGCDWTLMLDDDMVINHMVTAGPTDAYGFLERMIQHNRDICGVLYYQRGGECRPVLMQSVGERGYRFLRDDEITGGLQRVDVAGGGCLLIRTKIFDRLKYPYFAPEFEWGTDIQLCRQAKEKGFEVWADTSIELGHLKTEKTVVTSQNRRQFQLGDTIPGEMKQSFVAADIYGRLIRDALEWTGRPDEAAMFREANEFLNHRKASGMSDADWYLEYPTERVSRQVWFNTQNSSKKQMTQYIIGNLDNTRKIKVLDFGCGIGIPAFTLAEKGHDVTAVDIGGTGTFEFLKWRAKKYGAPIRFIDSAGGPPQLNGDRFDVIVAMDSIEHIAEWRETVARLGAALNPSGVLFSNNGILEDTQHPEHYDISNRDFIAACMDADMMPFNQITYIKKELAA